MKEKQGDCLRQRIKVILILQVLYSRYNPIYSCVLASLFPFQEGGIVFLLTLEV